MQIIRRGSKLWKLSTCCVIAFLKCSMTDRAYMEHGRSSDTNLAEIHEEMSTNK